MTEDKLANLKKLLTDMGSVAVAYSGGVDSTFLLKVAYDCLGERAAGITAVSPSVPAADLALAQEIAGQIGVQHVLLESDEMDDARYLANDPNRCYFCKSHTYDELIPHAQAHGFRFVVDGNNADDLGDRRPGQTAARERAVRSPLQETGFTKADIRAAARQLGLPNWDKPSAACLASRIPYGTTITVQALSQVERAELLLRQLGIRQVRVRHHDQVARIEVAPDDFATVLAQREELVKEFKALGYTFIALDLAGFRSGSMNEALPQHGR
ncbi:MAG: pyridinium-3,5-biscarboxylic acid mononucleotide sulfurtransferase [Chloroflexota bacterium]|nr:pyridinium-3,5-biscarboxylic acid mononucleotide sulfurtransferase [Chloroflexota bacterium]